MYLYPNLKEIVKQIYCAVLSHFVRYCSSFMRLRSYLVSNDLAFLVASSFGRSFRSIQGYCIKMLCVFLDSFFCGFMFFVTVLSGHISFGLVWNCCGLDF